MKKYILHFCDKGATGRADASAILGNKGANLAEMTALGIPVPPGFTITTEVCAYYYGNQRQYPDGLQEQINLALVKIEKTTGKKFGDPDKPLFVSVRSGAAISMPGMMDTVLDLGLNDQTVAGLARFSGNERFAWDSYRRFVQMYGGVVLHIRAKQKSGEDPFERLIARMKKKRGINLDTDLTANDLKVLVKQFKDTIKQRTKRDFPELVHEQLFAAIDAVLGSWMNARAITYRKLQNIDESIGTSVTVQAMVFGNTGPESGTGVAFTRDAANGKKRFYGEYLLNAQGEDVVAGIRTPKAICALKDELPAAFKELTTIYKSLEKHYRDMQDLEFTVEHGKLWLLQTRTGKRTGFAAIKIAVDMVKEKLISKEEAILRVAPSALEQVLRPVFDQKSFNAARSEGRVVAKGLNAGPGAATGRIAFHPDDAIALKAQGQPVILVRIETSPEDIAGMVASLGILTVRGGMTSHAAVVARQMGLTCIVGCSVLELDYKKGQMNVAGHIVKSGDMISLDGSTGNVILGAVRTIPSEITRVLVDRTLAPEKSEIYQAYKCLMTWADKTRRMKVRTNADLPNQSETALAFGAEGIGLCRTEHMFFGKIKIRHMRAMILAENKKERERHLKKLLPIQRKDFEGLFEAMNGYPVTIRTLDPPLHEFIPRKRAEIATLAKQMGQPLARIKAKIALLHEANPMLGHRGCRLGMSYPEITEMQVRAIFEAAISCIRNGIKVKPEIMIPLVGHVRELQIQEKIVRAVANQVFKEQGKKVAYLLGTMIELPRAALTADCIARVAEFFSFGTNDLTQTTLGLSRDDSSKFLPAFLDAGVYPVDPFTSLDIDGVGALISQAVCLGRKGNKDIKIGVCGEHGGDPRSIEFFDKLGLDYVSCSAFRVPIARLAAAQATLRNSK